MEQNMARILADGLAHGRGPREIARELNKVVTGLGKNRSETIARTEIIHAYSEGQLDSYEQMNIEEVGNGQPPEMIEFVSCVNLWKVLFSKSKKLVV
jgi:hypothetical protein